MKLGVTRSNWKQLFAISVVAGFAQTSLSQTVYEPNGQVSAARERAAVLHARLTGQKVSIDAKIIKDMEALISAGNAMGAARLATGEAGFYTHTVSLLGNKISNRPGSLRTPMNDLTATIIGFAKDDLDARNLLTANFVYRFQNIANLRVNVITDMLRSNNHYLDVDAAIAANPSIDLRPNLIQAPQQIAGDAAGAIAAHPDAAGILTSRAFLEDCANAGTNRRCYEKVVSRLTCHSLEEVANSSLPDDRVGRDVSRAPGGDPQAFQVTCKSCHSNMDAQRTAFAFTEFDAGQVKHGQVNGGNLFDANSRVANKVNVLGDGQFTAGYLATSDEWSNYAVTPEFSDIYGWRDANGSRVNGVMSGRGLNAYGRMISRSEAFSRCMVQNIFENVCRRSPNAAEKKSIIRSIASQWEAPAQGNYKLKWLFERVATDSACIGE